MCGREGGSDLLFRLVLSVVTDEDRVHVVEGCRDPVQRNHFKQTAVSLVGHHEAWLAVVSCLQLVAFISPRLAFMRGSYLASLPFRRVRLLPRYNVGVRFLRDNGPGMQLCMIAKLLVKASPLRVDK